MRQSYFPLFVSLKIRNFRKKIFFSDFFANSEICHIFISIKLWTLKNNDAYDEKRNEKSNGKDIPRNNERLNIIRKYNRDIKDTLQTINKKGFMSNVKVNFRNAHVAYYGKTIRPRNKNDPGLITVAEATGINTNRYYEPPRSNIADSRGEINIINNLKIKNYAQNKSNRAKVF